MNLPLKNERGKVHKPCAFNPEGADKEMCQRLSSIPIRAEKCESSKCQSPWRAKTKPAYEEANAPSPARAFERVLEEKHLHKEAPRKEHPRVLPSVQPPTPARPAVRLNPELLAKPASVPEKRVRGNPDVWRNMLDRVKTAIANSVPVKLDPNCIRPMKGQPRTFFDESSLLNLRTSIREVGQLQPGIVRVIKDGASGITHELLDGERRWRVVSLEGIGEYRAQLVEIDDEAAPYMIAAIANFNREGHTPLEISDAIERLHGGSIKVPMEEIAKIFGFGVMWAYEMHSLQNLHPDVRSMLDPSRPRGKILPTTAAIQISRLDKDLQPPLAERVLAKEINVLRLRQEIIKIGEAHGKPVRTREIKPSKVSESFYNRSVEIARSASVLLEQINEMHERDIGLPPINSPRGELLQSSLNASARDLTLTRELAELIQKRVTVRKS